MPHHKACLSLITNETNAQHWLPRDFKQECADHASSYPLSSGMCRRPSFSFSLGPNLSIPFVTYTDSTIDCMRASAVEEQQPLVDIEAHRFLIRDLLPLAASVLWPRIQLAHEKSPKALMHDGPRFPLSLCCFAAHLLFTLMDVNVKFLWSSGSRSMSQRGPPRRCRTVDVAINVKQVRNQGFWCPTKVGVVKLGISL